MDMENNYKAGDIVYVVYRNPHTYDVANVQEAAVVHNPEYPGELALFLYETYFPLDDNIAIYASEGEAERAYNDTFGGAAESEGELW
ncbi:transcriptional regulator of the spore photoproduct lyase operon [Halobacillus dabanensis]|uniref:Transcriptional regulator of the spore photoproduct lyase operon n=2 Tax=Halobacillus dabanensis TaxID=240302 RepID=A0A1I3WUI9_HALDA|nr:transcriptional regulator SplA domain-containing protein [Halobacillus dabanensis]SFK11294.1 transcriptional regulator of the spore photoproduct lyase operon [Halobacillus dabanensis]